jgi:hypothetical protein
MPWRKGHARRIIFTRKLHSINVRTKLVKWYIWGIALCGAENWTLQKGDQKYWRVLKCGAGERWRSVGPIM